MNSHEKPANNMISIWHSQHLQRFIRYSTIITKRDNLVDPFKKGFALKEKNLLLWRCYHKELMKWALLRTENHFSKVFLTSTWLFVLVFTSNIACWQLTPKSVINNFPWVCFNSSQSVQLINHLPPSHENANNRHNSNFTVFHLCCICTGIPDVHSMIAASYCSLFWWLDKYRVCKFISINRTSKQNKWNNWYSEIYQ